MLKSMTAFARVSHHAAWGTATWEIRSVNHRYLDIYLKIPDGFAEQDPAWRKLIQQSVQRGKIDCQLIFVPGAAYTPVLEINKPVVNQLLRCVEQLVENNPKFNASIAGLDLLKWPGAILQTPQALSALMPELTALLEQGLQQLTEMRQREGREIAGTIESKLIYISELVCKARPRVAESLQRQEQRLLARLKEIGQADPERIAQEMVIFANKWDVEEELDRLQCHHQEVMKCMQDPQPTGRRLDFLMQEMNREANTLASKSQDSILSHCAVELKVIIEQMREQIQNVE